jgi:hypothetical protein
MTIKPVVNIADVPARANDGADPPELGDELFAIVPVPQGWRR